MTTHLEEESRRGGGDRNAQLKFYRRYGWCSCGFGLAWALLTLCFLIINIIVFTEPQWIGDTDHSPGVGYVGLYRLCEFVNFGADRVCDGRFQDFSTILTSAFRASTWFVGVSCLVMFLCVLLFLLFICVYATYVYIICGILQIVSTIFMMLGCIIFPAGWDHVYVRRICGENAGKHDIGECEMRWAYILAIIGIFDILMLAILAFVLACHQRRRWVNVHTVKKPKDRLLPLDSREGSATMKSSRSRSNPKGYVVDVTGSQYALSHAPPPSYYGGDDRGTTLTGPAGGGGGRPVLVSGGGSQLGGRNGLYGSQPVYIVDDQPPPGNGRRTGARYVRTAGPPAGDGSDRRYRNRHDSI